MSTVVAVHRNPSHSFTKTTVAEITLVAGAGVEGDAHYGAFVKHRSRVRADAQQPNLRQIHLLHAELFEELAEGGFQIAPGDLGENITTAGVDLLDLPDCAVLRIGSATIRLTGLRNPCRQIERFQTGLLAAVRPRDEEGNLVRKVGVMGVVESSGIVRAGDPIVIELPTGPHRPLTPI